MEEKLKSFLINELLSSGFSNSKASELEKKLSRLGSAGNNVAADLTTYSKNYESNKKMFYERSINTLSQYVYTDTVAYLSSKLFSSKNDNTDCALDLLGKGYISSYVNFLDISYKHSKGIEFLYKVFSQGDFNEEKIKDLIREDVKERDLKKLIPQEILSNIY
jgi:hypothetical protein